MLAEALGVSFFDFNQVLIIDAEPELAHEHERFFRADDFDFGIAQDDFFHAGAVVWFHVIDDQIIEIPSIQHMFYIFQELTAYGPVYRIE